MATVQAPAITLDDIRRVRGDIVDVAARRGATNVRVFGSVARGDTTSASDVDFLIELELGRSLVDLGGLLMDLRELLGVDVDVVTEAGLAPRVRERVLAEAVPL